jgi:KTSC domain
MERKPLTSKMIVSAGFDREARVLEIEFRGGEIYEYRGDVSEFLFRRLLAAPSPGKFFHDEIEGKFPCIHASSPRWPSTRAGESGD